MSPPSRKTPMSEMVRTPRVLVPTDGPIYQSYQTPEGYLSLFTTDSMSLAIWTPPGLTATSNFGRMH